MATSSPGTKITRSLKTITTEIKDRSREINIAKTTANALREALKVSPGNIKLTTSYYASLNTQLENSKKKLALINEAREKRKQQNEGKDVTNTEQWKKLNSELEKTKANITQLKSMSSSGQLLSMSNIKDFVSTAVDTLKKLVSTVKEVVTEFASSSETIYNYAKKYNQSAEEFQLLSNAYQRVTGDANAYTSVRDSVIALQGRISTGNQKVVTDLGNLGLTLADLKGKGTDEVLSIITERRREMGDTADVASIAVALFGSNAGTYVNEMVQTSTDTIKQYNHELTENGMLSNQQVANGKKVADSLALMKSKRQALVAELGEAFSPLLTSLANTLTALSPMIQGVAGFLASIGPAGQLAVAGFLAVLSVLPKLILAMMALNASTGQWKRVMLTMTAIALGATTLGAIFGGISTIGTQSNYASIGTDIADRASTGSSNSTNTTNTKNVSYTDNSVNNYNITKDVDADAVIEEISNKRRTIGG